MYRLYPRELHAALPDHNPSEMSTTPLENTLLQLRTMSGAGESLGDLLSEVLEPPQLHNVDGALRRLVGLGMLSGSPEDDIDTLERAPLTALGGLAAAMPVDPILSRMIFLGVVFDCAPAALAIAASLALPRLPFRQASTPRDACDGCS